MKFEILVNTQCDGNVTLARVRGNSDSKTLKFSNAKQLLNLSKGDGAVVEVESAVERGNYIVPVNYKIIATHVSGKPLDITSLAPTAPIEQIAEAPTPNF